MAQGVWWLAGRSGAAVEGNGAGEREAERLVSELSLEKLVLKDIASEDF